MVLTMLLYREEEVLCYGLCEKRYHAVIYLSVWLLSSTTTYGALLVVYKQSDPLERTHLVGAKIFVRLAVRANFASALFRVA